MGPTLLHRIERYMLLTRTRPTRFGREAAQDPSLVFDLRRGRKLGPRTEARLTAFLDRAERERGETPCRRRR